MPFAGIRLSACETPVLASGPAMKPLFSMALNSHQSTARAAPAFQCTEPRKATRSFVGGFKPVSRRGSGPAVLEWPLSSGSPAPEP